MITHTRKNSGTCSRSTTVTLNDDGTIHSIEVVGGCNGNLQAISRVVEGMTVDQIEGYFRGISCNGRGTSCSDQLAQGVRQALESAK